MQTENDTSKPEDSPEQKTGEGCQERLVRPCECVNWCRDGRDMFSPHHPRCQHYTPPPADPRFARFGEAMWKYITKLGGDFCGEEISEDILPLAQSAGLCCRVEYDPTIHGAGIEADPGDEIWWWGDSWTNAHVMASPPLTPQDNAQE
jgi:hypothetical protein